MNVNRVAATRGLEAEGAQGFEIALKRHQVETPPEDSGFNAGAPVLCADAFLAAEQSAGAEALPHSWDVTSDSIAAWVALRWPADLTLLKSATPRTGRESFVDPYFPTFAGRLRRAEWLDLRTGTRGTFF